MQPIHTHILWNPDVTGSDSDMVEIFSQKQFIPHLKGKKGQDKGQEEVLLQKTWEGE